MQVEKFLERYETLVGGDAARTRCAPSWTPKRRETADEFLAHATRDSRRARRLRRAKAATAEADRAAESWGGVTIAYRRRLIDAPSYTLNHEEVAKALEEGIRFAEVPDAGRGGGGSDTAMPRALSLQQLRRRDGTLDETGARCTLPARTILVAAGTQPNTVLAREDADNVSLDGK